MKANINIERDTMTGSESSDTAILGVWNGHKRKSYLSKSLLLIAVCTRYQGRTWAWCMHRCLRSPYWDCVKIHAVIQLRIRDYYSKGLVRLVVIWFCVDQTNSLFLAETFYLSHLHVHFFLPSS